VGKVIAYFIPFPRPRVPNLAYVDIPERFLMYTLPQLQAGRQPNEEQAKKAEKIRQKQFKEITKAASKAKSANAAFLSRFQDHASSETERDGNDGCGLDASKGIQFDELIIVYPPTAKADEKEIRSMFLTTLIEWGEAYTGNAAKTAKMLSRRLTHNCICGHHEHERLTLTVKTSIELEMLSRYLAKYCWEQDQRLFAHPGLMTPTEQTILDALGWESSGSAGVAKGGKDWESVEMEGDLKAWIKKGAKEWAANCKKLDKENN
jgi:hypothetical protein